MDPQKLAGGVVMRRVVAVLALVVVIAGCSTGDESFTSSGASPAVTLVVPRFNGGSVPIDDESQERFWTQRGFPAAQLRVGPTYDQLIGDLTAVTGSAGHVIGASYDWRMPGAPRQQVADGKIEGLLSHWNDATAADTFEYAVDYLRYWLIQAVKESPGASTVNVVAHSTGVSIVRAYLQSDAYGATVLAPDGSHVKLPTIGRLILAAPPQQGAPFVWNLWNGNFNSFRDAARGAEIFAGYTRAYRHVLAGGTITGPGGDITRADLAGRGLKRQVSFLRQYNPLFRIVLPTTKFLYPAAPRKGPKAINNTADRNELLLDLNASSEPGNNPWTALADSVTVTYPVHVVLDPASPGSGTVPTNVMVRTEQGTGGEILPFTAFAGNNRTAIATKPGQTWYAEVFARDQGDGAFPQSSMQDMFFTVSGQPDPSIRLQQWGNGVSAEQGKDSWVTVEGNLSHNLFIENPAISDWISQQIAP